MKTHDDDQPRVLGDTYPEQPLTASELVAAAIGGPHAQGKAGHWSLITVYSDSFEPMNGTHMELDVAVRTEVPRNDKGEDVVRRGNRYYPTTLDVTFGNDDMWLHPHDARRFAAMLLRGADVADACDLPDVDACGHWAPCDCEVVSPVAREARAVGSEADPVSDGENK